MIRGRKVSDPVVHGATASRESRPGLAKAWDTVEKARSELRKIEQRLGEAERHTAPQLNETSEASITDYGVDNNHTFNVEEQHQGFASGAVVDNYGRSAYLRSKNQNALTRKTNRIDENHFDEEEEVSRKTSTKGRDSKKPDQSSKPSKHVDIPLKERNRDYNTDRGPPARSSNKKRVEFVNHNTRNSNLDTVGANVAVGAVGGRPYSPTYTDSTLTDSRAIRETEIKFLNDNLSHLHSDNTDVRWFQGIGPKLTHVTVTIPSSKQTSSVRHTNADPTTHANPTASAKPKFLELISEGREAEMDQQENPSESQSDSELGIGRRFKANLTNIDSDGLAKLREKIRRQQQAKTSPQDSKDRREEGVMGAVRSSSEEAAHRPLHDASDPILPRSQELIEGAEKQPKVRKIAAGPPAPSYKGFSEAETKYKLVESGGPKPGEVRRKEKKRLVSGPRLQERRPEPAGSWLREEDERAEKKKMMTRVIAPSKKNVPAKQQQKKEIITTSSWRAGQELIRRELGPVRPKKPAQFPKHRDTDSDHDGSEGPLEDRPESLVGEENPVPGLGSSLAKELETHRALSEEARKVYNDLQLDSDEEKKRDGRDRTRRPAIKRKAPKSAEPEKQQPLAKHRHYDADDVRKYMQKQKAERVRQQKEEEKRQKEFEEARQKQLDELRNKQKIAAAHSKKVKVDKAKISYDGHIRQANPGELPRHHPFHEDRPRFVVSGESDKENRKSGRVEQDMELSDSSSTLTGNGSMDELTPTVTPREPRLEPEVETAMNKQGRTKDSSSARHRNLETNSANVKTIGGLTFNMDGVMSKFTKALHEKLNEEPPGIAAAQGNSGYGGEENSNGEFHGLTKTRADRIRAIKETAATLQNRIQAEARKIQGQPSSDQAEIGATRSSSGRRTGLDDGREFVSRYERVTGAKDDYTVFRSGALPGTGLLRSGPDEHEHDEATRRIHAAYRQAVQQVPSGAQGTVHSGKKHEEDIGEDSTITETSTFSEITITEDSDNDLMDSPPVKAGNRLQEGLHSGKKGPSLGKSGDLPIPRPATHPQANSWDSSKQDPYNVFSIYERQRKQKEHLAKSNRDSVRILESRQKSQGAVEEPLHSEHVTSQQASGRSGSHIPVRSHSTGASQAPRRSESPQAVSSSQRSSYTTVSSRSQSLPSRSQAEKERSKPGVSSAKHAPDHDSDEDTIEGDSYTQTFDSEEEKTPVSKPKSASDKIPPSHQSLPAQPMYTDSNITLDDTPRPEDMSISIIGEDGVETADHHAASTEPLRYSPNALERRFYSELTKLDSMETSMRQLTGVERTRAVAMAQQETVSLAQMLKARQQAHDRDMKELSVKAQYEALEATQQLEDARKRAADAAINAADMIAKVRGESVSGIQESTQKLIQTQTEAAKATAEAAKFLAEARAYGLQDTNRLAVETAAAAAASAVNTALEKQWAKPKKGASERTAPDSARTVSGKSVSKSVPSSYTRDSYTRTKSGSSRTPSNRKDRSSIASLTGAEGKDESRRTESIGEEMSQGSAEDYSVTFDESMTEDEIEERSFRVILPSESHRKKVKHHMHSDNESVTSNEGSVRNSIDELFHPEESFSKFTEDMVKQFMKEEEMRAHHQQSLLRLREKALTEKTKAELAWLEQQKQRLRNKGADDQYPRIVQKQRGLKMKLQEQQAEIRRLREANKAASKERQRLIQQQQQIAKMRKETEETRLKLGPGKLGREVHTEAEVSSIDEGSDADRRQRKDYKSDSEIYTETKSHGKKSKNDAKQMEKYKKIHLDEKYLTQREHRLLDRRQNAEELLEWKKRLDREEEQVYELEKKALQVWDKTDNTEAKSSSKRDTKETKTMSKTDPSTQQDSTVISENVITARDESYRSRAKAASGSESSPDEIRRGVPSEASRLKTHGRSGSESSIPEEVSSVSSMSAKDKKLNDSSDDTVTPDYAETFEETATSTAREKKQTKSPRSPLDKYKMHFASKLNSPRSPFSRRGPNSESESEDSISHTETQSDVSDFEGRIRALNEDLRRRKTEAERLKRERKKKKKDLMKTKEESLKKQIEAYDNQISQLKADLQKEMEHEPTKPTVKPKIREPKVSPPKNLKMDVTPPKQRTDSEGSRSEDSGKSAQSSPSVTEDQKTSPPMRTAVPAAKTPLDKISEGSESKSERSEFTVSKGKGQKVSSVEEDKTDEIPEDIDNVPSDASEEKSYPGIQIELEKGEVDLYDVTYSETFSEAPLTVSVKQPVSARSQVSESTETRNIPVSARSVTEQVSEHISENISEAASEGFIKPIQVDLNKTDDLEEFIKNDISVGGDESDSEGRSPGSYSVSQRSDSRPSSERSERSVQSLESELSESEKTPAGTQELIAIDREVSSEEITPRIPQPKKGSGLIRDSLADIDDLLGLEPDDEEEEITPKASPRKSPDLEEEGEEGLDVFVDFHIGDHVSVTGPKGSRKIGTLLFKGNVQFAPGIWAGVELEEKSGRHDGSYQGARYFTCKPGHGVLVPGDDLLHVPVERSPRLEGDVRDSVESLSSTGESELNRLIHEADQNVQLFDDLSPVPSPRPSKAKPLSPKKERHIRNEELAEKITEDLLEKVMSENLNTIGNIASSRQERARKLPPPISPKPSQRRDDTHSMQNGALVNGNIEDEGIDDTFFEKPEQKSGANSAVNRMVNNQLQDAISKMLDIRERRVHADVDVADSGNLIDFDEEEHAEPVISPTDELERVLTKEEEKHKDLDHPPRPGSPIPGSVPSTKKESIQGDSGMFESEPENTFMDDDMWPPNKAPPPYPGTEIHPDHMSEISRSELQKLTEELFFTVPHKSEEISQIVSSAVDVFWTQRRYGEPLEGVQPPDSYYTKDESGQDLISNSRRVFKRLLFDLTGEIVRDVYKDEDNEPNPGWKKQKRKQQKYFKASSPPTTLDILKPVVQEAVIDILGLNGSRKADKGRWGIRKKKDRVDDILVQELREEEPTWVNYDDDELAVKMQLTDTIFDSLLTDTVQTMNKIFRKKQMVAYHQQK